MASEPVTIEQEEPLLLSFCTRDAQCQAEVDEHEPDCPVEGRLRETYGF